ncbi:hypothetical protein [Actinomadura luteofluorescens]|uniref:hypothetical protein n=1 Tax=Actinomadura luteofluorescens TaxID=46163 RepID=UPI0021649339|nr:hypothetical protein [Actinomadura glauciflava]
MLADTVGQTVWAGAWWRARASSAVVLGLAAVLLAALGAGALRQADGLRDDPSARNTALTDGAATSEVKGAVADMIGRVFSYDYADPGRTSAAVRASLTGDAVRQYEAVFGKVREDAPKAKTVLSTRVTDSAVTTLTGDRAAVLVFADQQTTRTGDGASTRVPDSAVTTLTGDRAAVLVFADQQTTRTGDGASTPAPAMLTVTAARHDGHWKITALDTFTPKKE